MKRSRAVLCAGIVCGLLSFPAYADWNVGDPHKMHFPQLPDPFGLDVNFSEPAIVADDWTCSETGPVTDIHFWFSAKDDWFNIDQPLSSQIANIHVSIHDDIPAEPNVPGSFSRPADPPRWTWDYAPDDPSISIRSWPDSGTFSQGWFDPATGEYLPTNHQKIYQVNITGITQPFFQEEGNVYWLDVSMASILPLGWKTADTFTYPPPYTGMHYLDDAVWNAGFPGGPAEWLPLKRPPLFEESIDMAFVITPEPASLLMLAALALVRRR